jgi:uncharacterized membrane protein
MVNDVADEVCQSCGAELGDLVQTYFSGAAGDAAAQPEGHTELEKGTIFEPAIGPFDGVGALVPTLRLFGKNFWLITKLVLVVFAPLEIFKAFSFGAAVDWQGQVGTTLMSIFCKMLVAPSLIFALVTVMRTGVAPSLSESYRWGLSRLGRLVPAALMSWFLQLLGFICLIIPGIIIAMALELIYPLATLKNLGPVEILKESNRLTKGHKLGIFCAIFVLGLLAAVFSIPLTLGLGRTIEVSGSLHSTFIPAYAVIAMIGDVINESFTVLSLVIYFGILRTSALSLGPPRYPTLEA